MSFILGWTLSSGEIPLRFPAHDSASLGSRSVRASQYFPRHPKHAAIPTDLRGKRSPLQPSPSNLLSHLPAGYQLLTEVSLQTKDLGTRMPRRELAQGGMWARTTAWVVPPRGIIWDSQSFPQSTQRHSGCTAARCTPKANLPPRLSTVLPPN